MVPALACVGHGGAAVSQAEACGYNLRLQRAAGGSVVVNKFPMISV